MRKVACAFVPQASTKGLNKTDLSSETLEMNHNLFFSALVVLLMVANLEAKWITYPACMLRVK